MKYLLFVFNIIFWLTGVALIVAGAVVKARYSSYTYIIGDKLSDAPIVLIVVGCIIVLIGFIGCCGAVREHYGLLIAFAVLMAAVFFCEIGAGIAAYVERHKMRAQIDLQMRKGMGLYKTGAYSDVDKTIDDVQQNLQCCGAENYEDWYNNSAVLKKSNNIPDSCCKKMTPKCGDGERFKPKREIDMKFNTIGCLTEVINFTESNIDIIGGIGIGIAIVQALGIVLSCCLARSIRRGYDTV